MGRICRVLIVLATLWMAGGLAPAARAQSTTVVGEPVELLGDGVALPAKVYRPATTGPRPGVVVAPGGTARGSIEDIEWLATRLAQAGYVALTTTWRAAYPIDDPRDVALALDWLERDPQVDASRLAIVGHSRGGMSALRTAAGEPRLRTVVALAPPADLAQNVRGTALFAPARHARLVEWMGGEPDDVRERYQAVQAIDYADRIRQPVLLVHGTSDMVAPPELSIWMERALRLGGNDRVRLDLIPGMGHFFELTTFGYQFDVVANLVADWLASAD